MAPVPAAHATRVPSLDGLRAVAVALVWVSHLNNSNDAIAAIGPIGVRIFFVVSGFIITKLLIDERHATGRVSLKAFYLRRTYRIFPACYAYVAFILLLAAAGIAKGLHPRDVALALTYTTNYAAGVHWALEHLWSLAVEEQFYLIWPFVFVMLPERGARRVLLAVVALAPLSRVASYVYMGENWNVDHMFHTVADSLATGCLIGLGIDGWRRARAYRALPSGVIYVWLAVAIAVAGAYQQSHRLAYYVAGLSILNLSIALFIVRVTEASDVVAAALNCRFMTGVGLISYSLYLWQQPFLYPFQNPSFLQRKPINILCAIVAALASYSMVEKPVRRWGTRMARSRRPAELAPS
jgi:peptidoglycan/LPS O-acetylase OafA/YrhL